MQVGVKMATGREVSGLEASQAEICVVSVGHISGQASPTTFSTDGLPLKPVLIAGLI